MGADHGSGGSSPAARFATTAGIAIALACTAALAWQAPAVWAGAAPTFARPWLPALGVSLAFRVDGLSLLFGLLIAPIGALVLLYSHRYVRGHPHAARLQLQLTAFMLSMLGLVLADDAILLFVFWELTTITSYLLIGFDHEQAKARRSALQALLVTGAGGLALLVGLLLLGGLAGDLRLSAWIERGPIGAHPLYAAVLALVLLGAFTKSAQVPFHFWLPDAMAAPTPVSAYLHSATMVKAGVYLLARLHPVLGGTDAWFHILTGVGAATALWGSLQALRQTDLKLALAYTTVVSLGFLVLFLGAEAPVAITAAITFLVVHALYKCALFLVVGIVDHATGTRDATRLGGLARAMPTTAAAAALAALSMAGFPGLLGFVGKELQYEAALVAAERPLWLASSLVVANALMFAVAAVVAFRPFWHGEPDTPRMPHEAPRRMRVGPLALALAGLAFGVAPATLGRLFVEPAVAAVRAAPSQVHLALWHGVNPPLLMSLATATLGILVYTQRSRLCGVLDRVAAAIPVRGGRVYDGAIAGLVAFAKAQTRIVQGGSLRRYLFVTFATVAFAVGGTLAARGGLAWPTGLSPVPGYAWPILALVAAGAIVPVVTASRLAAITSLGMVGAGVSLLFLLFGAPDLAMTQLLVETLFVVIAVLVLQRLPSFEGRGHSGFAGRARDASVAIAVGATVAAITLATLASPIDTGLGEWFAREAVPSAYGRNVVNVIIVDFRALDTLGESLVVVVAACAAVALLRGRRAPESESPWAR